MYLRIVAVSTRKALALTIATKSQAWNFDLPQSAHLLAREWPEICSELHDLSCN